VSYLTFRLAQARWALRAEEVGAIGEDREVRPLPLAPGAVLGLAAWRGAAVTVLDFAVLVGEQAGEGAATFVRLAPPRDHTALRIPARVAFAAGELEADVRLVDVANLTGRVGRR